MAETGALGLLAFAALIIKFFYIAFRRKVIKTEPIDDLTTALVLSVSGFLFLTFFDTIFHNLQPFLLFWLMMGWALAHREKSQSH